MHCTDSTNIKESNQTSTKQRPIRILHVVGGMNRGGIETWLMHVLRHIDRDRFQMDFLVHTTEPCPYDEEVRDLGSKIIPCLDPAKPWLYARNFKRILRKYEPYDIVHSHVHHFSGYVLCLAKQAGVSVRIAHSHNDTSTIDAKAGLYRRLYLTLTEWSISWCGTVGLGCSCNAVADLFGAAWKTDTRWQVLYYGVDLKPFYDRVDSSSIRAEFGIPLDAFVIGHIGRFELQKNHLFLLEIAAKIAKQELKMHLLLIGDGSLRSDIEQKVVEMGLSDRVTFTGNRSDIPRLMLNAVDVFLFPSLHEGLGLVLIEAQAAGLPCIFSDVVPKEADLVTPLLQRTSLSKSASIWAEAVMSATSRVSAISQRDALAVIENSDFNITASVKNLTEVYEANLSKR
jgi:glycosyltransferase involved in cell wall biosynthesis